MEIGLIEINIKIILFILLIYLCYKLNNTIYFELAMNISLFYFELRDWL